MDRCMKPITIPRFPDPQYCLYLKHVAQQQFSLHTQHYVWGPGDKKMRDGEGTGWPLFSTFLSPDLPLTSEEGHAKLIEWVKIALLFLYVTSKLFQFMILNLSG